MPRQLRRRANMDANASTVPQVVTGRPRTADPVDPAAKFQTLSDARVVQAASTNVHSNCTDRLTG